MKLSIREQIRNFALKILAIHVDHPVRIGIDGFCASGKTTIADHLANCLQDSGRPVIRASTDDFQHPPEIRWQLGQDSAEGFYRHAIDYDSLKRELLIPLGPGGSMLYRTSVYDIFNLTPNLSMQKSAPVHAVLLLDGLFLHGAELVDFFDATIFVNAPYDLCILRARQRNQERKSSAGEIEATYRGRYIPGYELYVDERRPQDLASLVIENT